MYTVMLYLIRDVLPDLSMGLAYLHTLGVVSDVHVGIKYNHYDYL